MNLLELFFVPNCLSCPDTDDLWDKLQLVRRDRWHLRMVRRNMRQWRDRAARARVFASPSFVLNGKVIFIGVPTLEKMTQKIGAAVNGTARA
ncbi:MAG: hypothetical protein A3G34_12350 [Candidatus Lindowbacteria bacterium RIFCSPLOWO2_12_FULL_62_27]|nr:MAG: hypothetical protein A3G34_12350 [Candidatus Lindowbacteria bacterium RIFCSPLOWO2_12_FULL_62_27]